MLTSFPRDAAEVVHQASGWRAAEILPLAVVNADISFNSIAEGAHQASGRRGGYDPVDMSMGHGISGTMAQPTESPFTVTAVFPGAAASRRHTSCLGLV